MTPFLKTLWYHLFRTICGLGIVVYYRCRWFDADRVPEDGPLLLVSNHQSYLDPPLVGVGCRRRLCYVARKTLFFSVFGWGIRFLDAIPIDQEGSSLSGIKETLRRLKQGKAVLIFPEGSRSHDGEIAPLQPGFCALARRSKASILPIGIDGAYQAWPINQRLPRPGHIVVQFGEPIAPDTIRSLDDDALLDLISEHITACHTTAAALRQKHVDQKGQKGRRG